ncbi:hypothetical protein [Lacrimispora amygdalina]|uniref:hypothetical protein n=1 Tax=Lacrimispora amygdalina TaxID=253257 RepID=UPI000BE23DE1|nr:hypothetical protein [Lacrimispora amygdalina]
MKHKIINSLNTIYKFENKRYTTRQCSILDLFLIDFYFYTFLRSTNGSQNSKYYIIPEIVVFLDKYKHNTSSLAEQKRLMINKWNESHFPKINVKKVPITSLQEKKEINSKIRHLIDSTLNGTIIWKVEVNKHLPRDINQRFSTNLSGVKYTFSLIAYKNEDANWVTHSELSASDKSIPQRHSKIHHNELYQAIMKHSVDTATKTTNNTKILKRKDIGVKHYNITQKDFIVKTSIFRCINNTHMLEEILGHIFVVTPYGKLLENTVPATRCPECGCYYILKNEFDKLSAKGRLLCQLLEKNEYYKNGLPGNSYTNGESVLMRNGYNVKKNNGLTEVQRQVILESMVAQDILSPHKIASYLSTFIAQKENLVQYKEAVTKWENDRGFILNYKNCTKEEVTVNSIQIITRKTIK